MSRLDVIQAKLDLLKQIVRLVEEAPSKEAALEALRRLLTALEAEYEELLLEDPMVRWALGSRSNRSNGLQAAGRGEGGERAA